MDYGERETEGDLERRKRAEAFRERVTRENGTWESFAATGKIGDYLRFLAERRRLTKEQGR